MAEIPDPSSWILAGGQFAAILATVMLFLRYLNQRDTLLQSSTKDLADRMEAIEKDCQRAMDQIVATFNEANRVRDGQIERIMSDHVKVTRETTKAVTELKIVVEALRLQVGIMDNHMERRVHTDEES